MVLSTSIVLMLLPAGCSDRASQDSVKEDTPYTRKVDSSIRDVAHRMASEGVDAEESAEQGVDLSRRYSSEMVRVDKEGRIQCYISLDPFGENSIDSLRALSVFIEREEATLSLVQAWVPYGRIRPLAELSFVRRIRPPDYPALR